jgi:hypothetical protein
MTRNNDQAVELAGFIRRLPVRDMLRFMTSKDSSAGYPYRKKCQSDENTARGRDLLGPAGPRLVMKHSGKRQTADHR